MKILVCGDEREREAKIDCNFKLEGNRNSKSRENHVKGCT